MEIRSRLPLYKWYTDREPVLSLAENREVPFGMGTLRQYDPMRGVGTGSTLPGAETNPLTEHLDTLGSVPLRHHKTGDFLYHLNLG